MELTKREKASVREYYAPHGLKPCWTCGDVLALDAFGADGSRPDGLAPRCQSCASTQVRNWRRANPTAGRVEQARQTERMNAEFIRMRGVIAEQTIEIDRLRALATPDRGARK